MAQLKDNKGKYEAPDQSLEWHSTGFEYFLPLWCISFILRSFSSTAWLAEKDWSTRPWKHPDQDICKGNKSFTNTSPKKHRNAPRVCLWQEMQILYEFYSLLLCKSLCMPAWSDKALVFVLEWTQTEMICNQKPCFDMRLRSKLIWFQREMLLPCGNVWKWAAENIKRRCFKHSVRSLIWHICPSASFKPFPLQMCHKTSGGFGSAVRPDGKRQRWLCGPVPVRRGRTRYPQNSVPATKTVPLHRRQLWGTNTARMWMVIWDGSHIKVVLQS